MGSKPVDWRNRSHFALSARLMRQILVDHARSRGYGKRGGGRRQVDLDEGMLCGELDWDLVHLDEALHALAVADARKARVVELRFFGGLSAEETAEVLDVSLAFVLVWRGIQDYVSSPLVMGRGARAPAGRRHLRQDVPLGSRPGRPSRGLAPGAGLTKRRGLQPGRATG